MLLSSYSSIISRNVVTECRETPAMDSLTGPTDCVALRLRVDRLTDANTQNIPHSSILYGQHLHTEGTVVVVYTSQKAP